MDIYIENKELVGKNLLNSIIAEGHTKSSFCNKVGLSKITFEKLLKGSLINLAIFNAMLDSILCCGDVSISYDDLIGVYKPRGIENKEKSLYKVTAVDYTGKLIYMVVEYSEERAINYIKESIIFDTLIFISADIIDEVMGYDIILSKKV